MAITAMRRIPFKLPESKHGQILNPFKILWFGYAIDGNPALMEVRSYHDGESFVPMPDALRPEQITLVKMLRQTDQTPRFARLTSISRLLKNSPTACIPRERQRGDRYNAMATM